ncbi:PR domain zinc finger protein 5-like isoform X2 [Sitophilus oryzae]|uniref:PR domain zinc finger protein 5-like isoform X2 n=1 Tax=Sitophilus oryzae TaxID=7048 RepID=A0A6J2XQ34_SITOR|nr:PR domain zinc finger protein 5-like isoform X2 [Sitophilus oryzae]
MPAACWILADILAELNSVYFFSWLGTDLFLLETMDNIDKVTYLKPDRKRSQKVEKVCRCSICGYQTQNMSYFKRHKKIHLAPEERQLFACTHCGQKYITKPGLKRHLVDNHIDFRAKKLKKSQKKVYRCAACGYQTPHRSDFRKHQIIHLAPEERQMFACMCCDKKYTSNQALRNHIIRDHIDSRNTDCISLTDEVIVDSLKMEIDDHAPFFSEFGNAGCLSATNDVKLEDFLKREPDVAPILNKDLHDDFKNTEDLSVNKEVKLEDFIKMEPDDGAAFLDEESRF